MKSISTTTLVWAGLLLLGLGGFAQASGTRSSLPPPTPLSYLCFEGKSAGDVTAKANQAGERGWRLVTAGPGPQGTVWCFEQISALRPSSSR